MIFDVLNSLCYELNEKFKYDSKSQEDIVILSNLVDFTGTKALQTDNQIYLQLIKFEEDRTLNRAGGFRGLTNDPGPRLFHAYIVLAANFSGKQYPVGLKYINQLLEFFVSNPILNKSVVEQLPNQIDTLAVELINLEDRELSNLWGAIGSKLLPHLYLKISLIPVFKATGFSSVLPEISGINPNVHRK